MTGKDKAKIVVEAAKIRKDYPELSYKEAIEKAKEVLGYEELAKMEKAN